MPDLDLDITTRTGVLKTDMESEVDRLYNLVTTYPDIETDIQNTKDFYSNEIDLLEQSVFDYLKVNHKTEREDVFQEWMMYFFTAKTMDQFDLSEVAGIFDAYESGDFYLMYRDNFLGEYMSLDITTLINGIYYNNGVDPAEIPENDLFIDYKDTQIPSWITSELSTIESIYSGVASKSRNVGMRMNILADMQQPIPLKDPYTKPDTIDVFINANNYLYMVNYMSLDIPLP